MQGKAWSYIYIYSYQSPPDSLNSFGCFCMFLARSFPLRRAHLGRIGRCTDGLREGQDGRDARQSTCGEPTKPVTPGRRPSKKGLGHGALQRTWLGQWSSSILGKGTGLAVGRRNRRKNWSSKVSSREGVLEGHGGRSIRGAPPHSHRETGQDGVNALRSD